MEILRNNQLWDRLGGPKAEALFDPSRGDLERCRECAEALEELQRRDESIDDAFATEIQKAVGMVKSLAWEDIRRSGFR